MLQPEAAFFGWVFFSESHWDVEWSLAMSKFNSRDVERMRSGFIMSAPHDLIESWFIASFFTVLAAQKTWQLFEIQKPRPAWWLPNCLLPLMVKEHVFLINDTYVVFLWFDMHFLKDMWVRWTCRTAFSFYGARKTCALAWFARAVVTGSNSCWEWPDVANWPTQPETAQPTAPTPTKWPNSALHKPTAGQSAGPNTSGAQPGTAKSRRAQSPVSMRSWDFGDPCGCPD